MKLPTLLVLFLAGSIPAVGATPQLQRKPTVQDSVQVSDQPETLAASNQLFSRENRYNFSAENRELEKAVCYKIRSYHMVREDQDSDVSHGRLHHLPALIEVPNEAHCANRTITTHVGTGPPSGASSAIPGRGRPRLSLMASHARPKCSNTSRSEPMG